MQDFIGNRQGSIPCLVYHNRYDILERGLTTLKIKLKLGGIKMERLVSRKRAGEFTKAEEILIDYPLSAVDEAKLIPIVEALLEEGIEIPESSEELLEVYKQRVKPGLELVCMIREGDQESGKLVPIYWDGVNLVDENGEEIPDCQNVFTKREAVEMAFANWQYFDTFECFMEYDDNITVINSAGTEIDYNAVVNYMDDEIRETLHEELAPCTEQEFFTAYEKAHLEKYGEEWELSKENPVW